MLLRFTNSLIRIPQGFRFPILWTNIAALLTLIAMTTFVVTENTDVNQNNFLRYKWCVWGPWSRCSAVRCPKRIPPLQPDLGLRVQGSLVDLQDDLIDPELSYCVIRTSNNSRRPARALIQELGRNRAPFTAIKVRYRKCCPSFAILNIFRLGVREECRRGQLDFQCTECYTNETIYLTRDGDSDDKPLAYCAHDSGSLQLAKILGGIAAAIIIVCLLACLIRLIVKYAFRRRSDPTRSTGSGVVGGTMASGLGGGGSGAMSGVPRPMGSNQRRTRTAAVHPNGASGDHSALQYLFWDRSDRIDENMRINAAHAAYDLPPAYKDVVKLPWIGFVPNTQSTTDCHTNEWVAAQSEPGSGPNPRPPHRFSCAIYDPEQLASSSQTLGPQNSLMPLPPSYEEIVNATSGLGRLAQQLPAAQQQQGEAISMEDRRPPTESTQPTRTATMATPDAVVVIDSNHHPPSDGSREQSTSPPYGALPPSIVQSASP